MHTIFVTSSILLWILGLFNLVLLIAFARRLNEFQTVIQNASRSGLAQLTIGQKPPSFSVETLDGEEMTLDSFSGKATAFIFVSPNCVGCREVPSLLQELLPEAEATGLEMVLVSVADQTETEIFLGDRKLDLTVLVAPRQSNAFYADWRVPGTPFYVFVDSEGQVQNSAYFGKEYFRQEWRIFEAKGFLEPQTDGVSQSKHGKGGVTQDKSMLEPLLDNG